MYHQRFLALVDRHSSPDTTFEKYTITVILETPDQSEHVQTSTSHNNATQTSTKTTIAPGQPLPLQNKRRPQAWQPSTCHPRSWSG